LLLNIGLQRNESLWNRLLLNSWSRQITKVQEELEALPVCAMEEAETVGTKHTTDL
jgi:hypothetical protein